MTEPERPADVPGRQRPRRDWRAVLVGALLGSTVGDAAVNILSGDYRWRFVTVVTATGLVLAVPLWLSHYPPRSTLVTATIRTLLAGAIIAAGLAAFSPSAAVSWEITAAALVTTGAVLIPAQPHTRTTLLLGIAQFQPGRLPYAAAKAARRHPDGGSPPGTTTRSRRRSTRRAA